MRNDLLGNIEQMDWEDKVFEVMKSCLHWDSESSTPKEPRLTWDTNKMIIFIEEQVHKSQRVESDDTYEQKDRISFKEAEEQRDHLIDEDTEVNKF